MKRDASQTEQQQPIMAKKAGSGPGSESNKKKKNGASSNNSNNSSNTPDKALQEKYLRDLHRHFKSVYGVERWETLSKGLARPTRHVALINPLTPPLQVQELFGGENSGWKVLIPNLVWHYCPDDGDDESSYPPPPPPVPIRDPIRDAHDHDNNDDHDNAAVTTADNNNTGHRRPPALQLSHYLLDGASLLPPLALLGGGQHQPNDNDDHPPCYYGTILDMCAAPGGKSLVLYYCHSITTSTPTTTPTTTPSTVLYCNEVNQNRRTRLRKVLESYVPSVCEFHEDYANVRVSSLDGRLFSEQRQQQQQQSMDAILIDAPCSSERHIIQNRNSPWSLGKVKKEATLQRQLLETAFQLSSSRRVVYSTCSIANAENDDVVLKTLDRVAKKYNLHYRIVDPIEAVRHQLQRLMCAAKTHHPNDGGVGRNNDNDDDDEHTNNDVIDDTILRGVERTQTGAILLPDRGFGWGPIFWSVLERVVKTEDEEQQE
jgi:16S rRNA methyltransferase RsmB/F